MKGGNSIQTKAVRYLLRNFAQSSQNSFSIAVKSKAEYGAAKIVERKSRTDIGRVLASVSFPRGNCSKSSKWSKRVGQNLLKVVPPYVRPH